jgi:hypothetical protein
MKNLQTISKVHLPGTKKSGTILYSKRYFVNKRPKGSLLNRICFNSLFEVFTFQNQFNSTSQPTYLQYRDNLSLLQRQLISGLETNFSAWNNLSRHPGQLISTPEISYLYTRDNLSRLLRQYILLPETRFCIKDNLSQHPRQFISAPETNGLNIK